MGPQNDEGEKGVFAVAKKMSPQTCRQESPTCMVIIICTLVPGVSRKGMQYAYMACPPIPFNQATCHSPSHSCSWDA